MKQILTAILIFCTFNIFGQSWQPEGTKYPNASNEGDTVSVQTRIPLIDDQGLLNYYLPVGDLLELSPNVTWETITGNQGSVNISGFNNDAGYLNNAMADGRYLQSETDPTVPNNVKNITAGNIDSWNNSLQPGENVSELNNDANYTTIAATDARYLRRDVDDNNGVNELTLGGLLLPSIPVGLDTYDQLVVNPTTGEVSRVSVGAFSFDVGNGGGASQFVVDSSTPELNFVGSGDTSVSFNDATNTVTITSTPGAGGGGAVTSFEGRDGAVTSQAGDYNTSEVTENGNLYFTEGRVRGTTLDGLSISNTPITSTNSFIQALGRLQGQINNREVSFSKNTAFNKNFGRSSGTVLEGNDASVDSDKLGGNTPDMYVPLLANKQAIEVSSGSANDVRGTGFFNFQGTISNLPSTGGHTAIEVARSNNGNRFQLASNHGDNSIYTRSYIAGSWSNWVKFWNTDNFNPDDYTPENRIISIGGVIKDLSVNRSWTLGEIGAEPSFTKNSAFNKNFGTTSGTVAQGNHTHNQLAVGDGLLGNPYDGSVNRLWTIDQDYSSFNNYYTKSVSDGMFVSTDGSNNVIEVSSGSANDIRPIGFYNLQAAVTDKPSSAGLKVMNVRRNSNESFQIASENIVGNSFYARNKQGGAWSNWVSLYHSGNHRSDSQNDARYAIMGGTTNSGSLRTSGNLISDNNIQASSAIISGAGSFGGRVSGADALNANEFVTRQQVVPLSTQQTGVVRAIEAISSALTVDGSVYMERGGSAYSLTVPAGTFQQSGRGILDIEGVMEMSNITQNKTLLVNITFSQGGIVYNSDPMSFDLSTTGGGAFGHFKATLTSRMSAGYFFGKGIVTGSDSNGSITQGFVINPPTSLDFRESFTIRMRVNSTSGYSMVLIPFTVKVSDLPN